MMVVVKGVGRSQVRNPYRLVGTVTHEPQKDDPVGSSSGKSGEEWSPERRLEMVGPRTRPALLAVRPGRVGWSSRRLTGGTSAGRDDPPQKLHEEAEPMRTLSQGDDHCPLRIVFNQPATCFSSPDFCSGNGRWILGPVPGEVTWQEVHDYFGPNVASRVKLVDGWSIFLFHGSAIPLCRGLVA